MKEKKEFKFDVNGFEVNCFYYEDTINNIFIPLLKTWSEMSVNKKERLIIFLVAPPAVGKTTLSMLLQHLSKEIDGVQEIQCIGLDGFHHKQDYIKTHTVNRNNELIPMIDIKGCPETYDIDKLKSKLSNLSNSNTKFPTYNRNIHDVIEDDILVDKDIILIEGNWLLLDETNWRDLKQFCDFSIFITAKKSILKERLIQRKVKGGFTYSQAKDFYDKSDSLNISRVLNNQLKSDIKLEMDENGDFVLFAQER